MTWRLISYRQNSACENMAIDEAVFYETLQRKAPPTLRFYGWRPAAVSIGYFQKIQSEINERRCRAEGVDIIRRLTGGKAVFHSHEITYSLVASRRERLFPDDIQKTYQIISLCLARALASLGIEAVLSSRPASGRNCALEPCCFSVPSGNELVVQGRKICGSAQMRTRDGFLQHGSLLMSFDPEKTAALILPSYTRKDVETLAGSVAAINEQVGPVTEEAVCEALIGGFRDTLNVSFRPQDLSETEKTLSRRLMVKYGDIHWSRRRTKESSLPDEGKTEDRQ